MIKEKWMLITLGIMNFILVIMHLTGYVLLFLKPTGYILPLVINIVMIIIILIKSKLSKVWTIVVITSILFISIPVMLFYSFILLLQDYSYTEIDNPYRNQSVIIEYRHATLGETTYFYNFYKTKFGFIGKRLNDQSITIMVRDYLSSNDAEGVFGLGNEEWLSANTVRFFTREGPKDIHLNPLQSLFKFENTEESIKTFMNEEKNSEKNQIITINGNLLTKRYDPKADQIWMDVMNESVEEAPTQQCSVFFQITNERITC